MGFIGQHGLSLSCIGIINCSLKYKVCSFNTVKYNHCVKFLQMLSSAVGTQTVLKVDVPCLSHSMIFLHPICLRCLSYGLPQLVRLYTWEHRNAVDHSAVLSPLYTRVYVFSLTAKCKFYYPSSISTLNPINGHKVPVASLGPPRAAASALLELGWCNRSIAYAALASTMGESVKKIRVVYH